MWLRDRFNLKDYIDYRKHLLFKGKDVKEIILEKQDYLFIKGIIDRAINNYIIDRDLQKEVYKVVKRLRTNGTIPCNL